MVLPERQQNGSIQESHLPAPVSHTHNRKIVAVFVVTPSPVSAPIGGAPLVTTRTFHELAKNEMNVIRRSIGLRHRSPSSPIKCYVSHRHRHSHVDQQIAGQRVGTY